MKINNWLSKKLAFVVLLFIFGISIPISANALLISSDGWVVGDGRLTSDTSTGLSWLDLSVTNNISYNNVFINNWGGLRDLGFRGATVNEVTSLFYAAGATTIGGGAGVYNPAMVLPAQTFIDLFSTAGSAPYSEGMVRTSTNFGGWAWAEVNIIDGVSGHESAVISGHLRASISDHFAHLCAEYPA